jgi:hypothetical protein
VGTVIVNKSGPNLLIRFVWWLFIGWWASGIVVGIAWIARPPRLLRLLH